MLLQYDYRNKQWALPCSKYILQDGSEKVDMYNVDSEGEKSVLDMCDMHSMVIVEKQDLTYTNEQEKRLEEINSMPMPDGWSDIYNDYVMDGILDKVNDMPLDHPMQTLKSKVIQNQQDELLLNLAVEISKIKGDNNAK